MAGIVLLAGAGCGGSDTSAAEQRNPRRPAETTVDVHFDRPA